MRLRQVQARALQGHRLRALRRRGHALPRCAASAWATSSSPPRSATSGTSRARLRAWATCSTSRRKDLEKVLYFASYIITDGRQGGPRGGRRRAARRARPPTSRSWTPSATASSSATRKLSADYVPEDDDFVDDVDEDERMSPEEVDEEIADIYEEFDERKALRTGRVRRAS